MYSNMRQLPINCGGHTRPVIHLDYSEVCECGYFMISASMDGSAMLRHGDTGDWVGTFNGHRGVVWSVALNKPAMLAATGSADFTTKLWDAVAGNEVQTFWHKGLVKSVAFDEASRYLLTAGSEKLLRVYDLECPEANPQAFAGHSRSIRRAIFYNHGRTMLSISDDRTLRRWDRASGREIQRCDFPQVPKSLELSKDGEWLTIANDSNVSFLHARDFNVIKEVKVNTKVSTATLHPKKKFFVCGGSDFKLYKYAYESGERLDAFKAHSGIVNVVKFSPDGEVFASGSEDGTLRLWQTTVGKNYGLWKVVEPTELNGVVGENEISHE